MKAYLDAIVDEVNLNLADAFGEYRYQISGLVKVVPMDENDTLLLQDSEGNRFAGVDDRYDLVVWHRADNTSFEVQENSFGDNIDDYNAITEITLYCYSNSLPGVNAQKLAQQLQGAIPSVVNIANQNSMGIGSSTIELSSINYNSVEVFNQVYAGLPYNLRTTDNMVSVIYTVTSEINKSCFDRCFNC